MIQPLAFGRIEKDLHPSKYSPELYLEARDVRILSTQAGNAGNLTPETGNDILFVLPDSIENEPIRSRFKYIDTNTDEIVYVKYDSTSSNRSLPDSFNIQIIGYATIEDIVILFSCDDNNQGQLWKWENNSLSLLYNNKLNFSIDYPIRDWVSRVENELLYKIYFTDFNNQLRAVNIKDSNLINLPPDTFNMAPSVTFNPIEVVSVNPGAGNFASKLVQYTYTLYNLNGSESTSAPLSHLITLKNPSNDNVYNNSITINFNVDTNNIFTNYKVYRIEYTALYEQPTVTLIKDETIEINSITITDDGLLNIATLSTEELLFLGNSKIVCKTLASYKNRLIAGNIKESGTFDIDYDARAYRFDSTGTARVDDEVDGPTYFTDAQVVNLPSTHDAINPSNSANTNQDFRVNNNNSNPLYNKYIYKNNGITLGGEGPNISYTFVETSINLDAPLTNPSLNLSQIYTKAEYSNLYKSYKRGETYRFGIKFYNKDGQSSFVKWIGDIKMPNQDTHPFVVDNPGGFLTVRPLHVEFTVKTNNLPDGIISYEIVRVERTAENRTIYSQGLVTGLIKAPSSESWAGAPNPTNNMQPSYIFRGMHDNTLHKAYYGYSLENNKVISDDLEWTEDLRGINNNYTIQTEFLQFISPEIEYNNVENFIPSSLNVVGGLSTQKDLTGVFEDSTSNSIGSNPGRYDAMGDLNNGNKVLGRVISNRLGEIESQTICNAPIKGSVFSNVSTDGTVTLNTPGSSIDIFQSIYMMDSFNNTRKLRGTVGKSLFMSIEDDSGLGIEKVVKNTSNQIFTTTSTRKYILVDLLQDLTTQYGGNTYTARQSNEYIPIVFSSVNNNIVLARNGDIFINMFNCQTKSGRVNNIDITGDVTHKEVILFPVESTINLDAKNNLEYNSFNNVMDLSITYSDDKLYSYSNVYNKENNFKISFPKPRNFNTINVYTNRLIASETKINGEYVDNWLKFKSLDYLDVEGTYGEINALKEFNSVVYTFQDSGIVRLNLQPNVQISADSGIQVQLGLGQFLYSYDYLTTNSGTQNQFSVCKSNNGIYYLDTLNRKFKLLGQGDQHVSDVKGMYSWFKSNLYRDELINDNPFKTQGISTMYNKDTMELILSVRTPSVSETLIFNELLGGFTSFHSYNSPMYFFFNGSMYSLDSALTGIWKHDVGTYRYYGQSYNPSITLVVSANPEKSKTFDYLIFDAIYNNPDNLESLLSTVRIYNSYQDSGIVPITSSNFKSRFREWRLQLPREQSSRNRIVSHYAMITLIFKPNTFFSLSNVLSSYTPTYV